MDDRLPGILRLLADHADYITIEQIAELTGAGVRTIHRDLERLERSLSLRGVRMERRRGYGIRLMDQLPKELQPESLPQAHDRNSEGAQRPFLILLYLITAGRWIKISELANTLMVSDSSVGTDLSALEDYLPEGVVLERQKGVGVKLEADEYQARMLFLAVFPRIFPRNLVLREGADCIERPSRQPSPQRSTAGRLLTSMGVYHAGGRIMGAVAVAEAACGFRFAPSFASLVYGYLFIVRRRLPERGPTPRLRPPFFETPQVFVQAAEQCAQFAFEDLISGTPPLAEIDLLARLLSAAEPADVPDDVSHILGTLNPGIERVLERTLSRIEERERTWLHDDQSLLNYLRATIAAALRRAGLGIPRWYEFALGGYGAEEAHTDPDDEVSSVLIDEVLKEFEDMLSEKLRAATPVHSISLTQELNEAALVLRARLAVLRQRRAADVRVKVLCYEGLGMSAYLTALAREVLPAGALIDSRWEGSLSAEEAEEQYDLIITTFSLDAGKVPVLYVDGDASPQELRRHMREAVLSIAQHPRASRNTGAVAAARPDPDDAALSLPTVMSVIHGFFVMEPSGESDIIQRAVAALNTRGDCKVKQLRADFERRESYGSLIFEEYGIQVLHCRSNGVPEPRAGMLRVAGDRPSVLVLTAPVSAPSSQARVLSELVVGLSDQQGFAGQLLHADRGEIQGALLSLFSRRALLS